MRKPFFGLGGSRKAPWFSFRTKSFPDTAGFTLIELMVVIALLGLLTYLIAPRVIGVLAKTKPQIAQADIRNLETALDLFLLDVGRYPTEDEGLKALYQRPDNVPAWGGPYLKRPVSKDPWGRDYLYKSPGEHGSYDLYSLGADGQPGGEGENRDLANW